MNVKLQSYGRPASRLVLLATAALSLAFMQSRILPASFAGSVDDFGLSRNAIGLGGAIRTTGGDFELSGSVGQPNTGRMAGGEFDLSGGFWFELVAGDCAEDAGVSTGDIPGFVDCLSGPWAATQGECSCGDLDGDGDTDLHDVAEFQTSFVAP